MFKLPENTDVWDLLDEEDRAFMLACVENLECQTIVATLEVYRTKLVHSLDQFRQNSVAA